MTEEEKAIKKIICKAIAEATGTPTDFQEGRCNKANCSDCIYSALPKALILAGFGNVEQAVREFAEELKERCYSVKNSTFDTVQVVGVLAIDRLLKERYGK